MTKKIDGIYKSINSDKMGNELVYVQGQFVFLMGEIYIKETHRIIDLSIK